MKNIPIPKISEYMKKLVGQMEKVAKNMRYRAIFYLKDENEEYKKAVDEIEIHGKEEKYGFKSSNKPQQVKEMEHFEKDLFGMAKGLEFREDFSEGKFQRGLKEDLKKMNELNKVIIAADKSRNFYTCDIQDYKKLRNENVTQEYKKSSLEAVKNNDKKSGVIAIKLKLDGKMQKHSDKECFITLKDHKKDFIGRPKCRLISPAKNELGRVVKIKLEEINREIRYTTGVNQWQSTQKAIDWFKNIKDPEKYAFLKFDIVSFYPSITPKLLRNAIKFARSVHGIFISKADEEMLWQCRKSFLFCDEVPWEKIGPVNFDVPMGSYDGAEVCELVGLYILHKITSGTPPIFEKEKCGIYRDDGLAIIKEKGSRRVAENGIKKKLEKLFESEDLKITVDSITQVTDYLDVKFNLLKHVHEPYRKPNNQPTYLNVKSNHPKHIIEHIPKMIEQRISTLSSTEEIFDNHKAEYENALESSGHMYKPTKINNNVTKKVNLTYQKPNNTKSKRKPRNVIYFNPPFSRSVKTNVIKLFLSLIDKHFPKGHKLHKCFNRNTVKATYCTMSNMKDKIGNHNGKLLRKKDGLPLDRNGNVKPCCQDQLNCPLQPDRCDQNNVVYQANVHAVVNKTNSIQFSSIQPLMIYYGSTEKEFKVRCSSHKSSFRDKDRPQTALSTYIWKLKEKKIPYHVNWSIKEKGHSFSSGGRVCDLCLTEKLTILTADQSTMLNKRDELLETCRHRRKHLLISVFDRDERLKLKPPDTTIK